MLFWHGGNLSDISQPIKHKKGRHEYGPGLYATTHYDTARKYSKGSRKLYLLEIEEGKNLEDATINIESAQSFIQNNVTKSKQSDLLERINNRTKDGSIPAYIFLNNILNADALKSSKMNLLREFLVDNGIDYEVVNNPFGWNETMVVLYNMNKIKNIKQITPKDDIKVFDLKDIEFSNDMKSVIANKRTNRIARILSISNQLSDPSKQSPNRKN
jgi:hypothetical protein